MDKTTMTTYRRADGELIYGEFSFVCDTEFFEDADETTEYVEEVWELKAARTFTLPLCTQCDRPATHWGLCEKHAEEDDPEAFDNAPGTPT